jgi:hypothetical protein
MSDNQQYSFGLNTRNISTSNRSAQAVMIGSIKGKGSVSRIYNWCNKYCPADSINCVFKQATSSSYPVPVSKSSWSNINISQLNLGEITGNIGLNGQIILGGSNGGQLQYSTNLGNSWAPYPDSPNLPSIQVGINVIGWSSVVMSDDTKFVIGTPYVPDNASSINFNTYNGIWYRRDSAGWFLLQSCPLEGGGILNFNASPAGSRLLFINAGISQDGLYMAAITTPRSGNGELIYLIFSDDAGTTWSAKALDPYTQDLVTTVASSISICNSVNDYFLITSKLYYNNTLPAYENGTCCVSGAGQPFVVPSGVAGNDFIYSSMSDNGLYQVFVTATNPQSGNTSIPSRLYLSSNSGSSFSQIIQLPYTNDNNYLIFGGVSMSSNGTYITSSVLDQDSNFKYIYISSDIGVTWTKIYNDNNGSAINVTGQYAGFLNLNLSGQYQLLSGTNQLYINNNYGI